VFSGIMNVTLLLLISIQAKAQLFSWSKQALNKEKSNISVDKDGGD